MGGCGWRAARRKSPHPSLPSSPIRQHCLHTQDLDSQRAPAPSGLQLVGRDIHIGDETATVVSYNSVDRCHNLRMSDGSTRSSEDLARLDYALIPLERHSPSPFSEAAARGGSSGPRVECPSCQALIMGGLINPMQRCLGCGGLVAHGPGRAPGVDTARVDRQCANGTATKPDYSGADEDTVQRRHKPRSRVRHQTPNRPLTTTVRCASGAVCGVVDIFP